MLGPHTLCMAVHLFRPQEPKTRTSPPVGTWIVVQWSKEAGKYLNWLASLTRHPRTRTIVHTILLVAGVVVQGVLLLMAAYLCDLALSLMELWAELARKHLEITL